MRIGVLGWLVGLLLLGTSAAAGAQKVYRCGPDGRIYQQAPCADGKVVDAGDPRSAEQRKAAKEIARSEAKVAAQYDRDNRPASAPKGAKPAQPAAAASGSKGAAAKKPPEPEKPPAYVPLVKPKPASSP